MSLYFIGILFALLAPALFAVVNILDSYLAGNVFKHLTPLIFFTSVCYVVFLPAAWWFEHPHWLPPSLLWIIVFIAVTDILYQYPYYWALREADTSIVTSLFSLGKILVPLFAFLLIGEKLTLWQYAGFFAIVFATVALSLDSLKLHFNRAFWYMALVSVFLAVQISSYKYAFEQGIGWSSVFSYAMVLELFIMCLAMIPKHHRHELFVTLKSFHKVGPALLVMESFGFLGSMSGLFALSLIPATVASGIGSLQALMVLLYAEVFKTRRRAKYFHESLKYESATKKIFLFTCIIIASILVVRG